MPGYFKIAGILIFSIFILFSLSLGEDSIIITTYYPSTYGLYNEMRANEMVIGDTDITSTPAPTTAGLLRFKGLSSTPSGANDARAGTIYYNTNDNRFRYYDGSVWKVL